MFPRSPESPEQMEAVTYAKVLADLDAAKESLGSGEGAGVLATTTDDRYLHHIFGSFAPIANHRPLYLLPMEAFSPTIAGDIRPAHLVGTTGNIVQMYEALPSSFLSKNGESDLEKAQALIDIREEAGKEGKKPPFMKNVKYRQHNLRLYKQLRKKLGGQLEQIVCDFQEPEHKISRFIRECGIEIQVMK